MSSFYNTTFAEQSIPIKQDVDSQQSEKKGFFAKILDKVNIFQKKEEKSQQDSITEAKTPVNPADKFPDPLFYDAVYHKKKEISLPLWLYNDKTNYENNHIPKVFHNKYIMDSIFPMIQDHSLASEVVLILEELSKKNDVNFNKQDKFGNTLLHYAIRYNNEVVFKKILQTGKANVNVCNYSYICPIHLAIYKQNLNEISQLVNYGADLRYSNDRFEMPIIVAIRLNYINTIYILAKKYKDSGISINEIDYIIFTAKQAGMPDIAEELYDFFMLDRELDN